ncbi:hypothetical protein Aperf_G00000096424 [Anoplocephala perfoliata]
MDQDASKTYSQNPSVDGRLGSGQSKIPPRILRRRQTTLDSMPPPVIGPDGFPIYKEPPHSDAPDVGMKVNLLTRIVHILMCRCTKRYYTAWMCSLGFMITFGIRCNMSWVTLAMEHHQARSKEVALEANRSISTVGRSR